jgi:hypothetical protein
MKKLLFYLTFSILIHCLITSCLYKDDSFIEFTFGNNHTALFTYFGKGTKGWKGLIFSETEDPSSTSLFVIAHTPNNVIQLTFPNLKQIQNTTITSEAFDNSILAKLDDITSFKFSVNSENFNQWNFISFVGTEKDSFINKEGVYVGYDHITTVPFNLTTYCKLLTLKISQTDFVWTIFCTEQEDLTESTFISSLFPVVSLF